LITVWDVYDHMGEREKHFLEPTDPTVVIYDELCIALMIVE